MTSSDTVIVEPTFMAIDQFQSLTPDGRQQALRDMSDQIKRTIEVKNKLRESLEDKALTFTGETDGSQPSLDQVDIGFKSTEESMIRMTELIIVLLMTIEKFGSFLNRAGEFIEIFLERPYDDSQSEKIFLQWCAHMKHITTVSGYILQENRVLDLGESVGIFPERWDDKPFNVSDSFFEKTLFYLIEISLTYTRVAFVEHEADQQLIEKMYKDLLYIKETGGDSLEGKGENLRSLHEKCQTIEAEHAHARNVLMEIRAIVVPLVKQIKDGRGKTMDMKDLDIHEVAREIMIHCTKSTEQEANIDDLQDEIQKYMK